MWKVYDNDNNKQQKHFDQKSLFSAFGCITYPVLFTIENAKKDCDAVPFKSMLAGLETVISF